MRKLRLLNAATIGLVLAVLPGCGGGGSGGSNPPPASPQPPASQVPGSPTDLSANLGDGALSVGWSAPQSTGSAPLQDYEVNLSPAVAAQNILVQGEMALIRGLTNNTSYSVNVRARSAAGLSPASELSNLIPTATDTGQYQGLTITGDPNEDGIFDPSLLRTGTNELWMAYSGVHYYRNSANDVVRDVSILIAQSTDNGQSYRHAVTVATPEPTTITDTDAAMSACGAATCSGRWNYETSWLIDDSSDPDPQARFKLFAHKYFLYPPGPNDTLYHLGAIALWTAPDPAGPWSAETALLGWNLTPPELTPNQNVNSLSLALADCLVVAEGGATVRGPNRIDLTLACPYLDGADTRQRIVLLRSDDHLASINYVATLLTPNDAASIGADHYTAPALLTNGNNAPLLIVTPSVGGAYAGCVVFPLADDDTGTLFRENGAAVAIQGLPARNNRFSGACSAVRNGASGGVLMSELIVANPVEDSRFTIVRSGTDLAPQ